MNNSHFCIIACVLLTFVTCANGQEPQRLTSANISPAVWGVLELPKSPGLHPAIILLHGSRGWRPEYAKLARVLADSGFVTLALSHFVETAGDTTRARAPQRWQLWQNTVRNAVTYLQSSPAAKGQPVGLVGFSHGAFLAISVASSIPGVRAVVDYYGGVNTSVTSLEDQLRNMPPLLVFHGDADTIVPVRNAYVLKQEIDRRNGEAELHVYRGAQHAFNSRAYPFYSDSLANDSYRLAVSFLRRHLRNTESRQ